MLSLSAHLETDSAASSLTFRPYEIASPRPSPKPLQSSRLLSPTSPRREKLLCMLVHVLNLIAGPPTPHQSLQFVPSRPKLPRVPAQSHTYRLARLYAGASANADLIRAYACVYLCIRVQNPSLKPFTLLPFYPSTLVAVLHVFLFPVSLKIHSKRPFTSSLHALLHRIGRHANGCPHKTTTLESSIPSPLALACFPDGARVDLDSTGICSLLTSLDPDLLSTTYSFPTNPLHLFHPGPPALTRILFSPFSASTQRHDRSHSHHLRLPLTSSVSWHLNG